MSTSRTVIVESAEPVSRGFLNVTKYALRHSTPDGGMSGTVVREVMERGHAAALIIYDEERDQVLLSEEFRIGKLAAGMEGEGCWSIGPVAGVIDEGETGLEAVIREAIEEVGIEITAEQVRGPLGYYSSPGGTSERLEVFVARADVSTADPAKADNDEGEYIRPVIISREDLDALVMAGDAPASLVAGAHLLDREFPRENFMLITVTDGVIEVDGGHRSRDSALNALRGVVRELARRAGHPDAVSADCSEEEIEEIVEDLDLDGLTWRIEPS